MHSTNADASLAVLGAVPCSPCILSVVLLFLIVLIAFMLQDRIFEATGKLGKVWRYYRKILPPNSRNLLAELLLDLRTHILPSDIDQSRYDVREI